MCKSPATARCDTIRDSTSPELRPEPAHSGRRRRLSLSLSDMPHAPRCCAGRIVALVSALKSPCSCRHQVCVFECGVRRRERGTREGHHNPPFGFCRPNPRTAVHSPLPAVLLVVCCRCSYPPHSSSSRPRPLRPLSLFFSRPSVSARRMAMAALRCGGVDRRGETKRHGDAADCDGERMACATTSARMS